jgi:hypothetical protein
MKLAPLHYATVAALTATLMLAGCKKEEPVVVTPPTRTAPAPAPMPRAAATASVTQVQLGSTAGADGRVTTESNAFAPTDTVTASVSTNTSEPMSSVSGTLTAKWTYQDGQVVNQQDQSFTFTGPGVTNFQISKPDGWPAGNYTLTVSLDGKVAQTREFSVR